MNWVDSGYGFYKLHLGPELTIVVGWEESGYKVTFAGYTLNARPDSLVEAKSRSIIFAAQMLKHVSDRLQRFNEVQNVSL